MIYKIILLNFDIRQQGCYRHRRNLHHHIHKRIDYIQDRIDRYQVESHNILDIRSWRFCVMRDDLFRDDQIRVGGKESVSKDDPWLFTFPCEMQAKRPSERVHPDRHTPAIWGEIPLSPPGKIIPFSPPRFLTIFST